MLSCTRTTALVSSTNCDSSVCSGGGGSLHASSPRHVVADMQNGVPHGYWLGARSFDSRQNLRCAHRQTLLMIVAMQHKPFLEVVGCPQATVLVRHLLVSLATA